MVKRDVFKLGIHKSAIVALAVLLLLPMLSRASEKSTLTLINQSGEDALVKLVGPSRQSVTVPANTEQTLHIAGGKYIIYVRYGAAPGHYRYSKGEEFEIRETADTYTEASLTLHPVAHGNYSTEPIPASEFDRVQAPSKKEQRRQLEKQILSPGEQESGSNRADHLPAIRNQVRGINVTDLRPQRFYL